MDISLQILDAARVTIASGETLDLSGYYIVFTSNIGSADLLNLQHSTAATLERHVLTRAQQSLRPEIYARITEKLVFHRLTYDHQLEIAQLMLIQEIAFLGERGYALEADGTVLPFLVRHGFHPKLGARPMRDAVEKLVGDAVTTDVLTDGKGSGRLTVDESANCLVVQ
jgi:ATP-dependent Clp protease ATP-binding subunit ClpB